MAVNPLGIGDTLYELQTNALDEASFTDTITAAVGGTQALAKALTTTMNNVTTVATAADSVKLPLAVLNAEVWVMNSAAANSMQVFGAGTDTINGVATATGVAQAAGKGAHHRCIKAAPGGNWVRILSA